MCLFLRGQVDDSDMYHSQSDRNKYSSRLKIGEMWVFDSEACESIFCKRCWMEMNQVRQKVKKDNFSRLLVHLWLYCNRLSCTKNYVLYQEMKISHKHWLRDWSSTAANNDHWSFAKVDLNRLCSIYFSWPLSFHIKKKSANAWIVRDIISKVITSFCWSQI